MSHEIRTPLNAVIGAADLLTRSPLQEEQRELASTIQDSGKGLLVLLNDILDLARLESEQMSVERIPFALRPLLYDALDLLAVKAEERGVELLCDIAQDVPTRIGRSCSTCWGTRSSSRSTGTSACGPRWCAGPRRRRGSGSRSRTPASA
jgi:signal transduction histidine kinase